MTSSSTDRSKCVCWRDSSVSYAAIGVFTLTTSFIQILVQTAVFTGVYEVPDGHVDNFFNTSSNYGYFSQLQIVYILYISLAGADFLVVVASVILLFGIEATKRKKCYFTPWVFLLPVYMIYESAVNIFFFSVAFSARFNSPTSTFITRQYGFLIVPLIYWSVKEILIFVGWVVVVSHLKRMTKSPSSCKDTFPLQDDYPISVSRASSAGYLTRNTTPASQPVATRTPTSFYQARYVPGGSGATDTDNFAFQPIGHQPARIYNGHQSAPGFFNGTRYHYSGPHVY